MSGCTLIDGGWRGRSGSEGQGVRLVEEVCLLLSSCPCGLLEEEMMVQWEGRCRR
jgi:hypothetical protein